MKTNILLKAPCFICKSEDKVVLYNINPQKTKNKKLAIYKQLDSALKRKKIPLCQKCHNMVYQGKDSGKKLTKK